MPEITPASFDTFGELIRYLRERAHLSQRELAAIVDYHYSYISRLEKNKYVLTRVVLMARFVPALNIQNEPEWTQRLIELAEQNQKEGFASDRKTEPAIREENIHRLPPLATPMIGRGQEAMLI